jgi:hypothetical protein
MDRPMSINVDMIKTITRLPTDGEKPKQYLEDKTKAKGTSDEIKAKYGMERGNRGIRINDINDPATRFTTLTLRMKANAQVSQRRSVSQSSSGNHAVHKGEFDELGSILIKFIFGGLSRICKTGALSSTTHGYSSSLTS